MTDFANEVQDRWKAAEEADKENREEALKDLKFAAGDQWDERVRQARENRDGVPLPCFTINTLPQFIGQVIGDRRANATSIKVLPREDGDTKVAEVRSELIRSIEIQSRAERVYAQAFEQAVTCGIGNFRIALDYAYEDAFERDLFIRGIANPLAVLWDGMATDPTGRDASYCFVAEKIRRDDYKARFGEEASNSLNDMQGMEGGWMDSETVRIAEFWRMTERKRLIAMMQDGKTVDVTEMDQNDWVPLARIGADGQPIVRESMCKYATMVMTNGKEELSDPFELKLPRLPVIRVSGREVWIGDKRIRYGLVRFARDPQRLKNYWRSVIAEQLMFAPRDNWIAQASAIKGREKEWTGTRVFNDSAQAPIPAVQANLAAIVNEAQMCAQDMKDTTGLHDASLGMASNETSGVAIRNRQHEGDIATIVYHDNMNGSMQEAGEILNALIPVVYDTARTIRTVGEDDAVKLIKVNDPTAEEPIDLGMGRYDVTISTGPAYMTKRIEAAAGMLEANQASGGQLLQIAGDYIAKAQDWPHADEIAERIKRTIPPNILGEDEQEQPDPAAEQAKMEAEAMQREMAQQQLLGAQAETRLKMAQAEKAEADARKAMADAEKAEAETLKIKADLATTGAMLADEMMDDPDNLNMEGGIAA